ncbi:nitrile hydratase accessory protein [Paraburkholderia bannensis]|uniref:nitrile hydratase accessory protein n=1 Tax=Paraburkholderia bannensis TaxID=765414 RepID=UPI002AB7A9CF|nr:nitrile hydratase accessory protein [Paraburkholderia bannensis]
MSLERKDNTVTCGPEKPFSLPWQAELFATTVHLTQRGGIEWKEWVEVFSEMISKSPQQGDETVDDAYFRQWAMAFENLLIARGITSSSDIDETQEHWFRSYINTPHGNAVKFSRDWPSLRENKILSLEANHHNEHHHLRSRPEYIVPISVDRGWGKSI